jgi:hypothetical protein
MGDIFNDLRLNNGEILHQPRRGEPRRRYAAEPRATSWEVKLSEQDQAYRGEYRLARLGRMGVRATEAILEVDEHVNSKGDLDPATLTQLRRIQMLTGRIAEELLYRSALE